MANGDRRRFQNTREGHYKFWECRQEGRWLHVTYGRLGTEGASKSKDMTTEYRATDEMARLVREKLGKGYVETTLAGVPFVEVSASQGEPRGIAAPAVRGLGPDYTTLSRPGQHGHAWVRDSLTDKHCHVCGISVRAEDACSHPEFHLIGRVERCARCGEDRTRADIPDNDTLVRVVLGPDFVGIYSFETLVANFTRTVVALSASRIGGVPVSIAIAGLTVRRALERGLIHAWRTNRSIVRIFVDGERFNYKLRTRNAIGPDQDWSVSLVGILNDVRIGQPTPGTRDFPTPAPNASSGMTPDWGPTIHPRRRRERRVPEPEPAPVLRPKRRITFE